MEKKMKGKKMDESGTPLCPFYHRLEFSLWDKIRIAIFSVTVLPLKILLLIPVACMCQLIVTVGLAGITFEETQLGPFATWRKCVRWLLVQTGKGLALFSGFIWRIKETGKRSTPEEAPIMVLGPHSSYFDSFIVLILGGPSVVAKLDTKDVPLFGKLVTISQAVYVARESKESRKQTMEIIKQRAQGIYNGSGMPQMYIYPEGTTCNRSSLIKFKPGAFAPGVPVQPVLLRYPNAFDGITFTFDGPPVIRNVWYAFTLLWVNLEIEFLPVYVPNEAEKNDPGLYADNVRRVMAESLQIPMSKYQFEDGLLLAAIKEKTKIVQKIRSIHHAKKALGSMDYSNENAVFLQASKFDNSFNWTKNLLEFQREFFNIGSEVVPEVETVFNRFKKDDEDNLDVRPYLALSCLLCNNGSTLGLEVVEERLLQMYNVNRDNPDEIKLDNLIQDVFEISEAKVRLPNLIQESSGPIDGPKSRIDLLRHRLARCLEFGKLYADETTERIPKTYPSREDRDKPRLKQKSS